MIPHQRQIFGVVATVLFISALFMIFLPRWGVLLLGVLASTMTSSILGIWVGVKDETVPKLKRLSFVLLGIAFISGGIIVACRIYTKVEQFGWLGSCR